MVFCLCRALLLSFFLVIGPFVFSIEGEAVEPLREPVPVCQICGIPITGVYYKIPGLPELYCEKCNKSLPHCFFCGRPVNEPHGKGRIVCPECQREVIQDPQESQRLVHQVRDWINTHLRLQMPSRVNFHFVEDLSPHVDVQLLGTTRELGAFIKEGEEVRILLISGMPRARLIETAAHELAHVWQDGRVPKQQRLLLKEGFAQWVASKVLISFQCDQALQVLREREDLYGQGYRIIQSVEDRKGVLAVLEFAKRSH